jgi:hypothetical protein
MRYGANFIIVLCALAGCTDGRLREGPPATVTEDSIEDTAQDIARDQRCDVPAPPSDVRTVQVVFSCDELPVDSWRVLDGSADSLAFALQELLAGPNQEERARGLSSFFSTATAGMLIRAELRGDVAWIDFADFSGIIPNASSSAGSAQLLDQIAGTLFQFDGVREAELSFNGSCDAFWNWLQRGCQRLARGASS